MPCLQERPEGASPLYPEGASALYPQSVSAERLYCLLSERPFCLLSERPVAQRPERPVAQRPERPVAQRPEGAVAQRPEGAVAQRPEGAVAGVGGSRTLRTISRLDGFEDRGSHRAPSTPAPSFSAAPAIPPAEPQADFEAEALVHMEALFRFARRLTGNEGDAEDLLQECYVRALRFWHNYRRGTNCKAWLFRIMHNLHINRWQARKRAPISTSLDDAEEHSLYQRMHDPRQSLEGNPEVEFLATHPAPQIREALGSLPTEFRTPVLLCDVEGLSYHEIARIMDIPVGTVRSRLNRARRRLQKMLHAYAAQEERVAV